MSLIHTLIPSLAKFSGIVCKTLTCDVYHTQSPALPERKQEKENKLLVTFLKTPSITVSTHKKDEHHTHTQILIKE